MTVCTNKVTLADFDLQIRAAAATLHSIGHDMKPEVTVRDALQALEEIPAKHQTIEIRRAIADLTACSNAKQTSGNLIDLLKSL